MLLQFNIFDFFYLSFVQLIVATVLVLSPARGVGDPLPLDRLEDHRGLRRRAGGGRHLGRRLRAHPRAVGRAVRRPRDGRLPARITAVIVIALQPDTNFVGQVFYASYLAASFTFIVYAAFIAVVATHSILEMLTASLVILLDAAAFVVWISNINYVSDVLCRARRRGRCPRPTPATSRSCRCTSRPTTSLPSCLSRRSRRSSGSTTRTSRWSSSTTTPRIRPYGVRWRSTAEVERVRFVHVAPWPGYKAGACNLVLRRYTDPRAEIIGLIDADDIVQPHYLRETAGYFSDPNLGFLQTFEGNREFQGSDYYTACVDSFQAFYLSVMSSRNERDTVPFVGTMGLFRRSALTAVGGWNEWCICEDTEASLRVTRDGWSGLYIPRCFGRGVVPPSSGGCSPSVTAGASAACRSCGCTGGA